MADRLFALLGALLAFLVVGAGAFGAHALRGRLTPDLLDVFETAARYQMYHALALLAVAWAGERWPALARRRDPARRPGLPGRLAGAGLGDLAGQGGLTVGTAPAPTWLPPFNT